jgi:hypothetical protein
MIQHGERRTNDKAATVAEQGAPVAGEGPLEERRRGAQLPHYEVARPPGRFLPAPLPVRAGAVFAALWGAEMLT